MRLCDFVSASVFVRAIKGKQLELSKPKLLDVVRG